MKNDSKGRLVLFSIFWLFLLVLLCSTALAATHHITGFENENICDTKSIALTYVDADGDYKTGLWWEGKWYPNETQVAVYYVQGDLSVGGETIDFGFAGHCGGAKVKGKFVIRFIDALATGWVWNNPNTWKEKKIKKISWKWWHAYEIVINRPNSYMQAKAYEHWNALNLVDSRSIGYDTDGATETIESETGFSELYFSTDFSISAVWYMWVYASSSVTSKHRDEIIGTFPAPNGVMYWHYPYGTSDKKVLWPDPPDGASPSGDIEAGDTNGDGVADFAASWANGLWVHSTQAWEWLWFAPPKKVTMANVYGDARKEVIGTWPEGVFYFYRTGTGWDFKQITDYPPAGDISAGDINGDGWDEVVSGYSTGTWIWYPKTGGWQQITNANYVPYNLACGDRNGDGRAEVVGGYSTGVWSWDQGSWTRLTDPGFVTTGDMEMGDFDKNGRDDLVLSFSNPVGMWIRYDNGSWYKANDIPPYRVTAGDYIDN